MPAKLKVLKNGLVVDEHDVTKQTLLIGRGEHCDVILNFPGIGREMAKLSAEKDGFYIEDVSVLGVFVDGQRVTRLKIKPGQEITCGSVQLSLVDEGGASGEEGKDEMSSATMLWEAGQFRQAPAAEKPKAFLVVKDKPDEVYEISGDEFVLGRSPDCQLPLPDKSVSKRHARIARTGTTFVLADLNSTNGTFLNDQKLTDPRPLKEGDRIKVGKFLYLFQGSAQAAPRKGTDMSGVIDMAKLAKQSTELVPEAPPPVPGQAAPSDEAARKKKLRLLMFAFGGAVLLLLLVVIFKSGGGPKIDMAKVSAVETLLRENKLADAHKQLDELLRQYPDDQRLKLLKGQLDEAEKKENSQGLQSLIERARARESAQDILGAVDLWRQILQKTPDHVETQKKLAYAAYRVALVYEGTAPQADRQNAIKYLEMVEKLVKKENAPEDYEAAVKLLETFRK